MKRRSDISVTTESSQIDSVEKVLLDIFRSERKRKSQEWLKRKLKNNGIELQFAHLLACFKRKNKRLLKFNPRSVNLCIHSLIKEFKEEGFDEKVALRNPGRLREFKRLGLPVNAATICCKPQTLLKNKRKLEELGLSVSTVTIRCKSQTLLENKRKLEELGLPVNAAIICRKPQILLKNKRKLEELGLPVNAATICCKPQTLLENKRKLEELGLPVNAAIICRKPQTLLENKRKLEELGLPVNADTICQKRQKY